MKKQTKKKSWEMRLIVILNDDLKKRLTAYCEKVGVSRSSIGKQALHEFLNRQEHNEK